MTTQDILARVIEISKLVDAQPVGATLTQRVHELRDAVSAQLRTENAARSGNGNAVKTIERMLKAVRNDGRTAIGYPWIDADGRQCVCDGFRAYRLRNALPLIDRPDDAGKPIDLDKVYPRSTNGYAAITLPDYSAVKSFCDEFAAENGRKQPPLWHFGKRMPTVNARYLLDLIAVFPDATEIKYIATPAGMFQPLVVECEAGDALLLPVRTYDAQDDWSKDEIKQAEHDAALRRRIISVSKSVDDAYEMSLDDFADLAAELFPAR